MQRAQGPRARSWDAGRAPTRSRSPHRLRVGAGPRAARRVPCAWPAHAQPSERSASLSLPPVPTQTGAPGVPGGPAQLAPGFQTPALRVTGSATLDVALSLSKSVFPAVTGNAARLTWRRGRQRPRVLGTRLLAGKFASLRPASDARSKSPHLSPRSRGLLTGLCTGF